MTNSNPQPTTLGTAQNPQPGLGYCVSPDGTQAAFAQGGACPVGWGIQVINDANKLRQMLTAAGGVVDIGPGSNSGSDIKPPTIGISLNPVTLDPGSFFTNPTGSAPGDIATTDLASIGGYLHKAAEHLTDPAFWKGSGLVLAGGVVLVLGFLLWSGIGQASLEATPQGQAYRRAQSGGVQNVRRKPAKEASDGE